MKILAPFLWLAAGLVALVLVLRARRGRVTVLRGEGSPRFVRLVAIAIVVLSGLASRKAAAQEEPGREEEPGPRTEPLVPLSGEFPASFSFEPWVRSCRSEESGWKAIVEAMTALEAGIAVPEDEGWRRSFLTSAPPALRTWFSAELDRSARGEVPPARLADVLGAAEAEGIYDAWLAGHLWRRSRDAARRAPVSDPERSRDLGNLHARLERHLRVANTLVRVEGITGRVWHRPWLSKAAPPPGHRDTSVDAPEFLRAARALYPLVGTETWATEATLRLRIAGGEGALVLVRSGAEVPVPADSVFDFRRLDLLRATGAGAVVLENALLGRLEIPAGESMTAHGAPEFLGPEATGRVASWVEAALDGDRSALARIERTLPASHAAIRRALEGGRDRPGAPALRMSLVGFDE